MMQNERDYIQEGEQAYLRWLESFFAQPGARELYEEEAAKKELWLQMVEARLASGLTQAQLAKRLGVPKAQVALLERCGNDVYTLDKLRDYAEAVGRALEISIV